MRKLFLQYFYFQARLLPLGNELTRACKFITTHRRRLFLIVSQSGQGNIVADEWKYRESPRGSPEDVPIESEAGETSSKYGKPA